MQEVGHRAHQRRAARRVAGRDGLVARRVICYALQRKGGLCAGSDGGGRVLHALDEAPEEPRCGVHPGLREPEPGAHAPQQRERVERELVASHGLLRLVVLDAVQRRREGLGKGRGAVGRQGDVPDDLHGADGPGEEVVARVRRQRPLRLPPRHRRSAPTTLLLPLRRHGWRPGEAAGRQCLDLGEGPSARGRLLKALRDDAQELVEELLRWLQRQRGPPGDDAQRVERGGDEVGVPGLEPPSELVDA
mmetsp:Transcript_42890/g.101830  ORF Transcript_42890/g.101830 Transcript_42890/m.101830 type:complete len:248 (-) Transcript_42890:797-1540(-)